MQINFYLDSNQRTKNPERIIFCYVRGIVPGKTIKLHTGERIEPVFWDKQLQRSRERGKNRYTGAPELNAFLVQYKEEIKKTNRMAFTDNPKIGYDEIQEILANRFKEKSSDIFAVFDSYLSIKRHSVSFRIIQRFNTLRTHLKNFEKEKNYELSFHSINHFFYDLFSSYLISDKGLSNNLVSKLISNLKVFLNWATQRKLNTNITYKEFQCRWNEADLVALSAQELTQLLNFDFSDNISLEKVRDVFCFGCFTGARYCDLEALRFSDIKKGHWEFVSVKTKSIMRIPMTNQAIKLVAKYDGSDRFPVFSNQKMNEYLKKACRLAGIDEAIKLTKFRGSERIEVTGPKYKFIGTHTARRTFVTLSLEKGMKPEVVMRITGHRSLKIFHKYFKVTDTIQDLELRKAWEHLIDTVHNIST